MPHIGASTAEAEENCAVMAANQLKDFLESGNIENSVNFPTTTMARVGGHRLTFSNNNVPKVLGNVLSILADSNNNVSYKAPGIAERKPSSGRWKLKP